MTAKERKKLKEAIYYLRAEGNNYEEGMRTLYLLAGMYREVEHIDNLRKDKIGIKITELFENYGNNTTK
jgi:hypothetical protein